MASPRTRDLRPCDNCRRRKIRCLFANKDAVDCVLCESRSTYCTYLEDPPRKKRALSHSPDDRVAAQQPQKQAVLGTRVKTRHERAPLSKPVLLDYTRLAGPSLLRETLGHQNRQSSSVIGATTDFDPSLIARNAKGEIGHFRPHQTLREADPSTYFAMRPDTQAEMDAELAHLDAIEEFVSPHGPELVKIYFRIVHPSFPILHKKVFLEKYGRSYRELTPTGLGAVYVLALNWWDYSQALSGLRKPDAKELEAKVLGMLFEVHRRPKISDLQGGLVLMQSPNVASWAMTGHLVAMGQNLGINTDCTHWKIPDWERGVRKRVAWALFMQDKWGSLVYGRGSHIVDDDWDVRPLISTDFPETAKDDDNEEGSAEIEKGKQTFLQMVSLAEILAEILRSFYTLRALRRPQIMQHTLDTAKPLQLKLRSWHENLPRSLSLEGTVPMKLSSVGYLHLAYYTVEVTLHRAIIRCQSGPLSPESENENGQLYRVIRHAAEARFTSSLEFVKKLKAEHFQSFWYFSSSMSVAIIGTFAGLLCATSRTDDMRTKEEYIARLAEYRWVLRVSSTGAEFMKYALGVLDAVSQVLEDDFGRTHKRRNTLPSNGCGHAAPVAAQGGTDGGIQEETFDAASDTDLAAPSLDAFIASLGNDTGSTGWEQPHQAVHQVTEEFGFHQPSTQWLS